MLNAKSDIPKRLPQQPVASALEIEPLGEEIATSMKAMTNANTVSPDGLPAELLKLGLQQDRTILPDLHRLTPSSGAREKSHSSGKTRSLPYSTRRAVRRSAKTTAVSRLCHMR